MRSPPALTGAGPARAPQQRRCDPSATMNVLEIPMESPRPMWSAGYLQRRGAGFPAALPRPPNDWENRAVPSRGSTPRGRQWDCGACRPTAARWYARPKQSPFFTPLKHRRPTVSAAATGLTWRRHLPSAEPRRWPSPSKGSGKRGATVRHRHTRISQPHECGARCTTHMGAARRSAQPTNAGCRVPARGYPSATENRKRKRICTSPIGHPPPTQAAIPSPPPPARLIQTGSQTGTATRCRSPTAAPPPVSLSRTSAAGRPAAAPCTPNTSSP